MNDFLVNDGWTIVCESPLKIEHIDGSTATGTLASGIVKKIADKITADLARKTYTQDELDEYGRQCFYDGRTIALGAEPIYQYPTFNGYQRGDDPKVVEDNEEFKPYSISNTRSLWLVWNVPSIKPSKMAEKRLLTVKELKQIVNNLPTDIDHHTVTISSKNYAGKWIAMDVGGVGLDDVNDELMFHGADYMLAIVQEGTVEED